MKTYYFTVGSDIPKNGGWLDAQQRHTTFSSWDQFATFCDKLSNSFGCTVRGCESEGYNNQGYYFNDVDANF